MPLVRCDVCGNERFKLRSFYMYDDECVVHKNDDGSLLIEPRCGEVKLKQYGHNARCATCNTPYSEFLKGQTPI